MSAVYTIQQFVEDARAIIDKRLGEEKTLEALSEPLSRVIATAGLPRGREESGNPDPEKGFPIYRAEDLEHHLRRLAAERRHADPQPQRLGAGRHHLRHGAQP